MIDLNSPLPDDATEEELVAYGESFAIDSLLRDTSEDIKQKLGNKSPMPGGLSIIILIMLLLSMGLGTYKVVDAFQEAKGIRVTAISGQVNATGGTDTSPELELSSILDKGMSVELLEDATLTLTNLDGSKLELSDQAVIVHNPEGELILQAGILVLNSSSSDPESQTSIRVGSDVVSTQSGLIKFISSGETTNVEVHHASASISQDSDGSITEISKGHIAGVGNGIQFITALSTWKPRVSKLFLVDTMTGETIRGYSRLRNGSVIKARDMPASGFDLVADIDGATSEVTFKFDKRGRANSDRFTPYSFAGNETVEGNDFGNMKAPRAGTRVLEVRVRGLDGKWSDTETIEVKIER
ncbi:MAG: hypothetical protein ACPGN3_13880 [Opitutales bacterium]